MSLFNRALRPPPILSDQAIERYLAAIRTQTWSPTRSSGAGFARLPSTNSSPLARASPARPGPASGDARWGEWGVRACTPASPWG